MQQNASARLRRQRDPERARAKGRRQYAKDPDKANAATMAWRKRNPDKRNAANTRWRKKHPEQARANCRKWAHNNRDKVAAKQRRYLMNPVVRVIYRHRWRINAALKRVGAKRTGRTLELLDCTAEFYKEFLEGKFLPGMTWENRILWHIDHVVAVSKHNIATPEGQRAAFHWTNTQPLWKLDNLRKGAS